MSRILVILTLVLHSSLISCNDQVTYETAKEMLKSCSCFAELLTYAKVDSPKGLDVHSLHRLVDDLIAEKEIALHREKATEMENKQTVGFEWGASEFAAEPPPEVSVADMNLDDTRKFVRDYDLNVRVSLENGQSKEDIIASIERAAKRARHERLESHLGFLQGEDGVVEVKYIVIGAGPSGLQQSYFLDRNNRDYIVFEKNSAPGTFFDNFPRSRRMTSLNRRVVGVGNAHKEAAWRFDANSLLSHLPDLKFSQYTNSMYPHADVYRTYLEDYASQLGLNIKYNSKVVKIKRQRRIWRGDSSKRQRNVFLVQLANGKRYRCRVLLVASGITSTHDIPGVDYTDNYETSSLDPRNYYRRKMLFVGNGDNAMEIAHYAGQYAAETTYISSEGLGLLSGGTGSYSYAGFRAHDMVNEHSLTSAQTVEGMLKGVLNQGEPAASKYTLQSAREDDGLNVSLKANRPKDPSIFLGKYDDVILTTGFRLDASMFSTNRTKPALTMDDRYPKLKYNFASANVSHMYFTGSLISGYFFQNNGKRAAGMQVGDWRYMSRALHNYLEVRYEQRAWPDMRKIPSHAAGITDRVKHRISQSAGIFRVHGKFGLGDLITFPLSGYFANNIRRANTLYLHEVPGLPDSATDIFLRLKNFHNKDMLLVRHFLTLAFTDVHCSRKKSNASSPNFTGFHPVVALYALPLDNRTNLMKLGKSTLLRTYHFEADPAMEWKDDNIHADPFQHWIENVVLRIISAGHLLPPQHASPRLVQNECAV